MGSEMCIRDSTLTLGEFEISTALEQAAIDHPAITLIDQMGQMCPDQNGNLKLIAEC